MRPLRIEFEAFGSYPGRVDVDFRQLAPRGLFVITGATGTGKTTIFDAMAYALYGEMPQKDGNDIRSHHAAPDSPTWVRFTFEVDGTTYVAERSPDYVRAKKVGSGSTSEKATALVTRYDADGTSRALATKIREARTVCTEVLGLSLEQFSRVMLLPQGSITRFLLDTSNEREVLLGQLFGGEVYERVVQRLKVAAGEANSAVERVEEDERHHVANAQSALRDIADLLGVEPLVEPDGVGGEQLTARLTEIEPALNESSEAMRVASAQADDAAGRFQEAEATLHRFDEVARLQQVSAALDLAAPDVEAAERSAHRSMAARPVVEAADAADAADAELRRSTIERDARCADLVALAASVEVQLEVGSAAALVGALGEAIAATKAKQALVASRATARTDLAETSALLGAAHQRSEQLAAGLARAEGDVRIHDDLLADIEPRRRNLDDLLQLTDRLQQAVRDQQALSSVQGERAERDVELRQAASRLDSVWKRFVATQAPRLATELRDGAPCPVCGACEHPAPAVDLEGEPVSFDDVQRAQHELDRLTKAVHELDGTIADLRVQLGEYGSLAADDLASRLDEHAEAVDEARSVESRYSELGAQRAAFAETIERYHRDRAALDSTLAELSARTSRHEAALAAAELECVGIDDEQLLRAATALERCRELAVGIESVFSAAAEAETLATERRSRASALLEASVFATHDEARSELLDQSVERRSIDDAATLRERRSQTGAALETLIGQGVPAERPEIEVLRTAAEAARHAADAHITRHTTLAVRVDDCRAELAAWRRVVSASADVRRRAAVARRAYQVCAGQGSVKINLRRWVLGNELDRVASAATVHLGRMTAGRYGIRRTREAKDARSVAGLDLEILDAHTGRPRHPRSLSGGEQFQASLALALGLADVMSLGGSGSGQRMEALFVDEGFGSLDPKALDDAIETLHQLHATGRMVGAITHVETMKERLHVGITVEALEGGRGSRLTVSP